MPTSNADNHELSHKKPVNYSKRSGEKRILNSRRATPKSNKIDMVDFRQPEGVLKVM